MKGSISVYRYTLVSRAGLNSRSERQEHHGALIRVGKDSYGYGCIHPWPELGDPSLEYLLSQLSRGETTRLSEQALRCAEKDAQARSEGVSLFEGLVMPRNHATVSLNREALERAQVAGFEKVKVKVGRDLDREAKLFTELAEMFDVFRWRLDFNHSCSLNDVEHFLYALGEEICLKIDWIEDAWLEVDTPTKSLLGVPLAVDRWVSREVGNFPFSVVKPACEDVNDILKRSQDCCTKVVFTSYMDHPLGQSYAAWHAAVAHSLYPSLVDMCGLVTHELFRSNDFSRCLGGATPQFQPALGTGLGFDHLLEELPWKPIT